MKKAVRRVAFSMALMMGLSGCGLSSEKRPDEDMVLKITASSSLVSQGGGTGKPWSNISFATSRLFRNLFTMNAGTGEIGMDLAKSYEISDDGLVYEIVMKDNAIWSDGEVVDAEDVEFSLKSVFTFNNSFTLFLTTFSDIVGAKEYIENPEIGSISGIEADGYNLKITLETPNHLLLSALSQFAIFPEHILKDETMEELSEDKHPFWLNPVTNGMYKYGERVEGVSIEYVYNEDYPEQAPYIHSIVMSPEFTAEELTYYETSDVSQILDYRAEKSMVEHSANNLFYRYFVFNIDKGGEIDPVLSDVRVRKALTYAIDRETLVKDIYYNTGDVIQTGVVAEYNQPLDVDYPYDPEKAKELLAEAEYDFNRPIELLYYYSDETSIKFMEAVAKYLEAVGLTVNLVKGNLYNEEYDYYDMGLKGLSAFSNADWYNEYLSTSNLHQDIFGGEPLFDELVAELNATTNAEDKIAVLQELQELEYELLYKYPIFSMGHMVYVDNDLILPDDVVFGDSKYKYDIQLEEWKINTSK